MKNNYRKDIALDYFVNKIRKRLGNQIKQFILFGSRARRDNMQDSDYDCLVIVNKVSRPIKDIIDEEAGKALYQYNAVISAFIIYEEKYRQQPYNPLLMNIAKEGIAL